MLQNRQFIGALIAQRWAARNAKSAEEFIVPVASGIIAGESLAAAGFAVAFLAVAVPKTVPDEIKARLNQLTNEAILDPAIKKRLIEEFALNPRRMTLEECMAYDRGERERWARYVKIARIEPQ